MSMLLKKRTVTTITKDVYVPGKPFNPNFDGNLLAWYDGDTLATDPPGRWLDRSVNAYDLTLFNNPTLQAGAINGHDALRFDGINQYALNNNVAFVRNQPTIIYIVFKVLVANVGRFFADGFLADTNISWDLGAAGLIYSVFGGVNLLQADVTTNYNIRMALFNGLNSENRINNAAALVGNAGANNANGFCIGANPGGGTPSNIEVAYCIVRDVADNTATQNIFINFLKNRFAL